MTTIMFGDGNKERADIRDQRKIVVPDEMLKAAADCHGYTPDIRVIRKELEAALRWLSENPIVPTQAQWEEISSYAPLSSARMPYDWVLQEWQRRMFDAPKEDDPLIMYIMRHIDDIVPDERERRNRAESAVADYEEHVKRNSPNPSSIPPNEFVECDACSAKPGSPPLCSGCLHNREVINSLKRDRKPQASEVPFGTGFYVSPKSNDFPVAGFTEPEVPEEFNSIKRYDFNPHDGEAGMNLSADGDYVLFSDAIELAERPKSS